MVWLGCNVDLVGWDKMVCGCLKFFNGLVWERIWEWIVEKVFVKMIRFCFWIMEVNLIWGR